MTDFPFVTSRDALIDDLNDPDVRSAIFEALALGERFSDPAIRSALLSVLVGVFVPLESPVFTGTPTVPTASVAADSKQIANVTAVRSAVAALVNAAPSALDTLNELAAALGNDANFAATMASALAGKQPLNATLTALAAMITSVDKLIYATGSDTFATTALSAYARTLIAAADDAAARTALGAAPIASPAFSGTPTVPTASVAADSNQIANVTAVRAAVAALVNASPAALDTLKELATALGNDPNFATTMATALAGKQPSSALLSALDAAGSSANKVPYFTAANAVALADLTATARTLLAATTTAARLAAIGADDAANLTQGVLKVARVPHLFGTDGHGYARLANNLTDSDVLGSVRLYLDGTFAYWYNGVEKWRVETDGKMTAGSVPISVITNMKNGGSGSTQYFQINGRNDGDQEVGGSIRISTSQSMYFAYNGATMWTVDATGTMTAGSVPAERLVGGTNLVLGSANTALSFASTDVDGLTYANNSALRVANDGVALELQRRSTVGSIASFFYGNTQVGSISVSGTATAFNTSSDWRLKRDVEPLVTFTLSGEQFDQLDGALLRVMLMRPVSYRWHTDEDGADLTHGFLAHELQGVAPHAVTGAKDGMVAIGTAVVPERIVSPAVTIPPAIIKEAFVDDDGQEVPAVWSQAVIEPAVIAPEQRFEGVTEAEAAKIESAIWSATGERPVFQQVDHSKLVADLTAALQSATLMILEQRDQIAALAARVDSLTA